MRWMGCRRVSGLLVLVAVAAMTAMAQPDAVRINNRGVAQMGQQFTERAAASFAEAFQKDPTLAQAAINEGIALLYLQKPEEARSWLEKGTRLEPRSPQGWYNLGLAQHAANDLQAALVSFRKATEVDPRDADTFYFIGVCYRDLKQYAPAIEAFQQALSLDPLHASAEFSLAQALQRSGRTTEVKPHLKTFQHLSASKISSPIGLSYGERGHYSTVSAVMEAQPKPKPMIAVRLVAETLLSQVPKSEGPGAPTSKAPTPKMFTSKVPVSTSSWTTTGGACMMDVAGEGRMDLVLMQSGAQAIRVLVAKKDGGYADFDAAVAGLKLSGRAVACAVGDFDGDGLNDLAVALDDGIRLFRNLGKGKFEDVTEKAGLSAKNKPSGITFLDYDHDGDLDLFLTGTPLAAGGFSNVLWRNNGNGSFTEWTETVGLGGSGSTRAAILTDFNNDRAVDIAVTGDGASPLLYVNPREGKYPTEAVYGAGKPVGGESGVSGVSVARKTGNVAGLAAAQLPPTVGIAVLDFNKDGWMDIAVTHEGAPGLTLWRNVEGPNHVGRSFERVQLPLHGALRGWGLTPIDIDNDGWIDLAVLIETGNGAKLCVLRNRGDGSFEDVSAALGLDKVKLSHPRGLIAVSEDGATNLIVTQLNAAPVLLCNVGGNKNHSVLLNLLGYADNKTATGVKVEIFAGGLWQKWELAGASGYATQGAQPLLVGLGDE